MTQKNSTSKRIMHFMSGAVAGVTSRTAIAPIERIVILKQLKIAKYLNDSFIQMLYKMVQTEGLKSCFKGNGANSIRIAPWQAIEFFAFEYYAYFYQYLLKQFGVQRQNINNNAKYLFCGALAGMTATTLVYPLDLVKTLLATQTERVGSQNQYQGIFRSIFKVSREQGFFSLYKGWVMSVIGIAPYASIKLSSFYIIKNLIFGHNQKTSDLANLVLGSSAGIISTTFCYPMDLLRRRFQIKVLEYSQTGLQQKVSLFSITKGVLKQDGFTGLYRGLAATYLKQIPSVALAFAINEKCKQIFQVKQLKI